MRLLDRLTIVSLLIIGIGLCAVNVWYAAARSTIPLAVSGTVIKKYTGTEKHPGVDDVHLITMDDGGTLRIDGRLFEQLNSGNTLSKQAWQNEIDIDGQLVPLDWSQDFHGLIWCMALAIVIMCGMVRYSPPLHSVTDRAA